MVILTVGGFGVGVGVGVGVATVIEAVASALVPVSVSNLNVCTPYLHPLKVKLVVVLNLVVYLLPVPRVLQFVPEL